MRGLVTACGVEDFLSAGREIDRSQVPLIVAAVARIAAVRYIKVRRAGGRCGRKRRGTLLVEALQGSDLRPAASDDFGAVAELIRGWRWT